MIKLIPSIPGHEGIRNIIFDFGNVICDIDISLTEKKFLEFGPAKESPGNDPANSSRRFDEVVEKYEAGMLSSAEFREIIRNHYVSSPSDAVIDEAWNALLLDIPERRIRLLKEVRKSYPIFLLSNSNEIHYLHYLKDFRKKSGLQEFDDLFEKAYFSFRINLTKPSPVIFDKVVQEQHLIPSETLFIDDTLKHVNAARDKGIIGYHLQANTDICSLFI